PSAPFLRASAASAGVSAFANTLMVLFISTHCINRTVSFELLMEGGDSPCLLLITSEVIKGKQGLSPPSISSSKDTVRLMQWVDMKRTIRVLANADTPADAAEARKNGAEG